MGFATEESGVLVFNEMDDASSVRELTQTLIETVEQGELTLKDRLNAKLEGSLPYNAVHDLPWQNQN